MSHGSSSGICLTRARPACYVIKISGEFWFSRNSNGIFRARKNYSISRCRGSVFVHPLQNRRPFNFTSAYIPACREKTKFWQKKCITGAANNSVRMFNSRQNRALQRWLPPPSPAVHAPSDRPRLSRRRALKIALVTANNDILKSLSLYIPARVFVLRRRLSLALVHN